MRRICAVSRRRQHFFYVAFVIDTLARRIVGWRVSRTAHVDFVLDALEQVIPDRRPVRGGGLVHHSDRGAQYVSIKYTEPKSGSYDFARCYVASTTSLDIGLPIPTKPPG